MKKSRTPILMMAGLLLLTSGAAFADDGDGKEASVSGKEAGASQIARGGQAWQAHCHRCHNLRTPNEKQDYEWDISVNHMRAIANLPGDTAEDIKAFLKQSN